MKYSDFEKHLKSTLSEDKVPVNMDALLGGLNLIEKPNRKKPWLWWISSAIILMVVSIGIYAFASKTKANADLQYTNTLESKDINQEETVVQDQTSLIATTNQEIEDPLRTAVQEQDLEQYNSDQTISTNSKQRTFLNRKKVTPSTLAQRSEEKTSSLNREDTNEAAVLNTSSISYKVDVNVGGESANEGVYINEKVASTKNANDRSELDQVLNINTIARPLVYVHELNPPSDKIKCPTFTKSNKLRFSIIPELGYMVPDKNLADESSEVSPVTAIRMGEEKSLEGLQAALYGRLSIDGIPLYIKAGLSYTRISERLPLAYEYTEYDTTQGIISLTTSPTGDTITAIIGDIVNEVNVSGHTTKHYFLHQWDFPIALGYERPLGGFVVGVEGGVNINLRTSVTGNILNTEDQFRPVDRAVDVHRRVGLGYFGGVTLGKYINGFGDIYLAARARYIPDVSNITANTKQTYRMYGIHAGYMYTF